jgi:hypothetical protein
VGQKCVYFLKYIPYKAFVLGQLDEVPAQKGKFMVKQPGLDGRHRDLSGRISEKHGNTRVGTLRETYGDNFAVGTRSDAKLSTILERAGVVSLSQLLKKGS